MPAHFQTIVAIPVRDEEQHLRACLAALAAQTRRADAIVLLLNNCRDGSLDICRAARHAGANIHIVGCQLRGDDASAGEARRLDFEKECGIAPGGVICTTDADSVVPATWIADILADISAGADCVCGMAVIDHAGGADRRGLAFDDMREALLLGLQDEIAAMIDPDPFDPWPRHQQHSGASIAVRAEMLRRAGGAPRVAAGEDRALVAHLGLVDARIRHAPDIQVAVSGRLQGRAAGGMAATMTRRLARQDQLTDETLEPTVDAFRRCLIRARLRDVSRTGAAALAADLMMAPAVLRDALRAPYFGAAWAAIQRESPILRRRRVAFLDLARETRQALALRDELLAAVDRRPDTALVSLRHAV